MEKRKIFFVGRLLAVMFVVLVYGFNLPSAWAEGLKKVEAKFVCMVNNNLYPKEQISIVVDKKTYFGCCEMCKEKLGNSKAARTAIDPVSKRPVDKADAVIGASEKGKIFYFENLKNLEQFDAPS